MPAPLAALANPDVMTFFHEKGTESRFWLWESFLQGFAISEQLINRDPLKIQLTVSVGEEVLRLVVDEALETLTRQHEPA
jgi:hypothetical protein